MMPHTLSSAYILFIVFRLNGLDPWCDGLNDLVSFSAKATAVSLSMASTSCDTQI